MSKTVDSVMIHKRKRDKFDWNGMGLLLEESRIGKIQMERRKTIPGRALENQQNFKAGNKHNNS